MDAELLIKENMRRLTLAARKLSRNFGVPDMLDDLIQEGSLALMEAAERYDTSGDASFDVYSDRIIKSAMLDYIYRNATQFTMPPDRFRVLRHVARLLADGGGVQEICGDLNVSPAVARKLILEYRESFNTVPLDDADADTDNYGNPEQIYTEKLQRAATFETLNSLSSRSRTIIRYHLGLDQPDEQTMTFKDLAVRLNYNSPGAADKAYKRAAAELRRIINAGEYGHWRSSLQAVRRAEAETLQTDCHIPWSEVNDLAEQFIAHVAILQRVYSILSEY